MVSGGKIANLKLMNLPNRIIHRNPCVSPSTINQLEIDVCQTYLKEMCYSYIFIHSVDLHLKFDIIYFTFFNDLDNFNSLRFMK